MKAATTIDQRIYKYVGQMNAKEKQAVLGIVNTIVDGRDEDSRSG